MDPRRCSWVTFDGHNPPSSPTLHYNIERNLPPQRLIYICKPLGEPLYIYAHAGFSITSKYTQLLPSMVPRTGYTPSANDLPLRTIAYVQNRSPSTYSCTR